jgi:16S rRNA processing protein RimM
MQCRSVSHCEPIFIRHPRAGEDPRFSKNVFFPYRLKSWNAVSVFSMGPRLRGDDDKGKSMRSNDDKKSRNDDKNLLCAAVITSAHGIQGQVKLKCFLENPADLGSYSSFSNEKGEETYKIKKIIVQDKDILVVSFEGINNRTEAEQLKGKKLMVARERLPNLSEDTFYHTDLIGLLVKSLKGKDLGIIQRIYNFGAGDILEIKTPENKLEMIPFTQAMVPVVDIQQGFVSLNPDGEKILQGEGDEV